MKHVTDHPYARSWWDHGVVPAMLYLKRANLLRLAAQEYGVLAMAIELNVSLAREKDRYHAYLDDIRRAENSAALKSQMMRLLSHVLTSMISISDSIDNGEFEDEMVEHAKTCTNPDCEIKKLVESAEKIAVGGLKLST